MRCRSFWLICAILVSVPCLAAQQRLLVPEDLARLAEVSSPSLSPDGNQLAYTVTLDDVEQDARVSQVWVASWDGLSSRQYTHAAESSHTPRFSPDGKWLALLSDRGRDDELDQLCLMPSSGGEARCLTDLAGGVSDYQWAPDSRRLVLVSEVDPDGKPAADPDKPAPIVIDRFQFKEDITGFLGRGRSHLFLLDLEDAKLSPLTQGPYNELLPSWSPDGRQIAFVSKRGEEFDRHNNWDLYLVSASVGAEPRQLTVNPGSDGDPELGVRPSWSPDGKRLAYLRGGPPELIWYGLFRLGTVDVADGKETVLSAGLDRNVMTPAWSPDGREIYFLLEDDQSVQLAKMPARGGDITRLTAAGQVVSDYVLGPRGIAMLLSSPTSPYDLHALEDKALRRLSNHNAWLDQVSLATVSAVTLHSPDDTEVHALLMLPANADPGPLPALLRLHGGPVSQRQFEFEFYFQALAARGYLVVAPNPRGSSGRGEMFQRAIWADWGNTDVQDVLATADFVVQEKLADPRRLGVYGWSYGGMLTNYVIASDNRFGAAISGAGISNMLAGYGDDHYVREWEAELGLPWENLEGWLRVSYPFYRADKITTPTLFMVGQEDFNVPLIGSEQMYQALRRLGVETGLVIYPGQNHTFTRPSFVLDRLKRYIQWFDAHLSVQTQDGAVPLK